MQIMSSVMQRHLFFFFTKLWVTNCQTHLENTSHCKTWCSNTKRFLSSLSVASGLKCHGYSMEIEMGWSFQNSYIYFLPEVGNLNTDRRLGIRLKLKVRLKYLHELQPCHYWERWISGSYCVYNTVERLMSWKIVSLPTDVVNWSLRCSCVFSVFSNGNGFWTYILRDILKHM